MKYNITIEITNQTKGGLYEFQWDGEFMRFPEKYSLLNFEAETIEDAHDNVIRLSNNTVKIVEIVEDIDDMATMLQVTRERLTVLPNKKILRIINSSYKGIMQNYN